MRNILTFLTILIISALSLSAQVLDHKYFQDNWEVFYKIEINDKAQIEEISKYSSIDYIDGTSVYGYASEREYKYLTVLKYVVVPQPHPGDVIDVKMSNNVEDIRAWDVYPTYDGYLQMMNEFVTNYPNLCELVDAGTTVNNRNILFLKISDNISTKEAEPQFMYTSSMHGDEITGYVLMLRLIDSLLTNYGSNPRITNLVDNVEIWINPLANPDGTYQGGNNTVNGARRYNANFYDINRNFPDPEDGPNPNGPWQPETIRMMDIAEQNNFVMSSNFHGGIEVVNYPWDTWSRRHTDDSWFQMVSREYADLAQANSPNGYMTALSNGITNGYDWYRVAGGRQDYMNYFRHGVEITIELSDTKLISPSLLPAHWDYNKEALLTFMEKVTYGITGVVSDTSGNPIRAKIKVLTHDVDSSEVYSDLTSGHYSRLIKAGTYNVEVSAPGHFTQTINSVNVIDDVATQLNVQLVPEDIVPVELISFNATNLLEGIRLDWSTATETNNAGFDIERKLQFTKWEKIAFIDGYGTTTNKKDYSFMDENLLDGIYSYRLIQKDYDGTTAIVGTVEVNNQFMLEYKLAQNYPNPFNPTTTISFTTPVSENVTIAIYNSLGEKVKTLIDNTLEAGSHNVEFNAGNLSSGIYFYKLETPNYSSVKKLILMK